MANVSRFGLVDYTLGMEHTLYVRYIEYCEYCEPIKDVIEFAFELLV
jgi:hypothetical protein